MGAPGEDAHIQQRTAPSFRQGSPSRDGAAALRIDGHFFPVLPAAADGSVDLPLHLREPALRQGPVMLLNFPLLQHPAQLRLGFVVLGHQHQSAGIPVQPVHDARPLFPADAGEAVQLIQQRVDQRSVLMARGGMHHHAPGLDHHRQIPVLIQHLQGQILGDQLRLPGSGHPQEHFLPRRKPGSRLADQLSLRLAGALFHQGSHPAAAEAGNPAQQHIQPLPAGYRPIDRFF